MSQVKERSPEKLKNCLTKGKVIVQFIPDFRNGIQDKAHPLYGGLSSNASISIPAPLLTKRIDKIFTKDELEFLGSELNEDLSANSTFWREYRKDQYGMVNGNFPMFLKKEGDMLHRDDALDFIKIRILEDSDIIANSQAEIKNKASQYRFVLIEQDKIHQQDLDIMSLKKNATNLHTKYEKNEEVLAYVLKAFNKNVSKDHKLPFLQKETWKLSEMDPIRFAMVLEDEFIEQKIVLDKAVAYRLVTISNKLYFTSTGDPIKLDGFKNDSNGAARFLASGAGQEMLLTIEAQIEEYENKKR